MAKTALVVDDSPTMRNMVKLCLEGDKFEVSTAQDGVKAFKLANNTKYDVIITDINMPNMDGIELIRMLREESEANKFTPILVLTTEGGDAAKSAGKLAGASGWIVKPFEPEILVKAAAKVTNG
jgi:two-component system chemotaxis response regulator CheY